MWLGSDISGQILILATGKFFWPEFFFNLILELVKRRLYLEKKYDPGCIEFI